ncbi:MAG: methylated-DNA--[protein]-cysteine S-methyltransferase [Candidatus Eremiobacteraeota bacterium]|nr:methylated-DNA--[protein]-cysteine S-methyltransferase [Candidatus Eremiobacteraeota bacterium]
MIAEAVIATPLKRNLHVVCDDAGIVASRFTTRSRSAVAPAARTHEHLRATLRQLDAYFARRLPRFDLPLVMAGTPFQLAVWNAVAGLETGELASYAEIARAIGRPNAHRGVAGALAKTPLALFVPAHRVVGSDGRVRGAAATSMRRRLLEFERSSRPSTRA